MAEDRLVRSIDELPIALTVPEAARVLRVSKNKLYDLVRLWQATGGVQGLRAVRLGRALRIPRQQGSAPPAVADGVVQSGVPLNRIYP